MHDLITRVENEKNLYRNEGRQGVENLCKLVRLLGYEDRNFAAFAHDGAYGDLIEFLEDNPGCIEAIKEWIGNQNVSEWREALEAELPEVIKDNYENGECPDCGEEIPDDAKAGEECSNCGHVWTSQFCDCGHEKTNFLKDMDGTNIEEVYGCPICDS